MGADATYWLVVIAVFLALGSALAYGLSDFVAGISSRRATAWAVAIACQVASLAVIAVVALGAGQGGAPRAVDLAWASLAAVGNALGTAFLYRGFASGRMSVVAPISAVGAAVVPVAVGFALGERPGALVWAGIVAALPGIWCVSRVEDAPATAGAAGATDADHRADHYADHYADRSAETDDDTDAAPGAAGSRVDAAVTRAAAPGAVVAGAAEGTAPAPTPGGPQGASVARRAPHAPGGSAVRDAVIAGVGFGVLFVGLGQIPREAGLAPVVLSQGLAATLLVTAAVLVRAAWRPTGSAAVGGGLAGALSAGANLAYLAATQQGSMTVAAILTALYPAVTILLAAAVLREHIDRVQATGLVLCGAAVALVAAG